VALCAIHYFWALARDVSFPVISVDTTLHLVTGRKFYDFFILIVCYKKKICRYIGVHITPMVSSVRCVLTSS